MTLDINYTTTNPRKVDQLLETAVKNIQSGNSITKGGAVILCGDSFTALNGQPYSTLTAGNEDAGWFAWFNVFVGQKFSVVQNLAVGGSQLAQISAQVDAALLTDVSTIGLMGGINDILAGANATTTWSRMLPILEKIQSSGKLLILANLFPNTSIAGAADAVYFYNKKLEEYCRNKNNIIYLDLYSKAVDAVSTTGAAKANYLLVDTVHPTQKGMHLAVKAACTDVLPLLKHLPARHIDSALATPANSAGNVTEIASNPLFIGTGGTAVGATGTVAAGYTCGVAAGTATMTLSVSAANTGIGNKQVMAWTAAATIGAQIGAASAVAHVNAGDYVEAEAYVKMTGMSGILNYNLELNFQGTSPNIVVSMFASVTSVAEQSQTDWEGWVKTPMLIVPTGTKTSLIPTFNVVTSGASAGTVEVERFRVTNFGANPPEVSY